MTTEKDHPPVELNYRDVGSGEPVVFVHGWGMSLDVWDRQVLALADEYRVICVDVRGHGDSPKPADGYTYDDHVADLRALFEKLGLSGVTLVGWSMGGGISSRFAARTPFVNKLVLVGAPPKFEATEDFPQGLSHDACVAFHDAIRTAREETMWETADGTFHVSPGERILHWLYQLSLKGPVWSVLRCYEGVLAADVREDLTSLDIPVLLLHGVYDRYISIDAARWTDAHLPNATLVEFEESGHAPFLEEPAKFNAALRAFLAEP
jgi:pimeloyl-ACP methyl ester esterase